MGFVQSIVSWYQENGRNLPWRSPERSDYEVLIAELFLKKTTAEHVKQIYEGFISEFPRPDSVLEANEKKVKSYIESLGLKNKRYKELIELCKYLSKTDDIKEEDFDNIRGVGNYVSAAFMVFQRKTPRIMLDTNVRRIMKRFFGVKDAEKKLEEILPCQNFIEFYYGIIDLGGLICKDKIPKCEKCPFKSECKHFQSARKN